MVPIPRSFSSSAPHDELLAAAVEAQREYVDGMEQLRAQRTRAFKRALAGTVTAVELAGNVGMSNTQVARIARGQA